ncbi:MAG TPA: hypothetical protein VFG12_18065 [Rhodopila sp.]|nr:hypothetical protein [Rhodopila sp.]
MLAAGFAVAVAALPAKADTIVTFTGTDSWNDVTVSGSFSFDQSDMPVSGLNMLSSFVISFTPYGTSTQPAATFTPASETSIIASATTGYYPTFDYDDTNADMPLLTFEFDGLDYAYDYFGFYLYTGDGVGYQYGVDGVEYGGMLDNFTITEDAPEPAGLAVLASAMSGLWLTRRRRAASRS